MVLNVPSPLSLNPSSTGIRFRGPAGRLEPAGRVRVLTLLLLEYGFGANHFWAQKRLQAES